MFFDEIRVWSLVRKAQFKLELGFFYWCFCYLQIAYYMYMLLTTYVYWGAAFWPILIFIGFDRAWQLSEVARDVNRFLIR